VLNAKWYGVPQSRERAIFVGVREDLGVDPSHPPPTVEKPITAGEALVGAKAGEAPRLTDRYGRLWVRVPPGRTALTILKTIGREVGYNTTIKLSPHKVAPTITKTQGGKGFATLCHWQDARALSTEEAQRLASFPDDFVFTGDYHDRWARIGNCVPPLLMRAVAAHVKSLIAR
jgi:DNA (cytosine-5)-methyltransferase 1